MNTSTYREESIYINFGNREQLHMKRFCGAEKGTPVFLLHGSIENGKIFYSSSGKGLAPFLAQNVYDVFVADLRGKGKSTRPISRSSRYGNYESITQEIPAFLDKITEIKGAMPLHWIAHSWGGVLLLCNYARYQSSRLKITSMVFFGVKRRISIRTFKKFFMVEFVYGLILRIVGLLKGFVDAVIIGAGSDTETLKENRETWQWIMKTSWVDTDGFDYGIALPKITLPPALYIAGSKDDVLGHPKDVQLLIEETGNQQAHKFYLASKKNGNLHDYDHINMLTHHDAVNDHFPMVVEWMRAQEKRAI
ncbi:MAG: alpha/beta hydrolase [Chitinophagales bacterium]